MKKVKIQLPDNCELVQEGNTWIVREKVKKTPNKPTSWKEFCEKYSICDNEFYITDLSSIESVGVGERNHSYDRNACVSEEEAGAFLALMQLRQLRKVWVGDWDMSNREECSVILYDFKDGLTIYTGEFCCYVTMSFPEEEMAREFCDYFKDLLEKAKCLL